MWTRDFQAYNANYVGGDITGGVTDLGQLFTRPVARADPYTTPERAHLHLLQLHASRRRRPRHVRLLRSAAPLLRRVFGKLEAAQMCSVSAAMAPLR